MNQDFSELVEYLDKKFQETATKGDIGEFRKGTNEKFSKLATLEEFDQFKKENKEDINSLREQVQALTTSVDGLVKFMTDSKQEDMMAKKQTERYEKWFQIIADKLGLKLES